MASNQKKTNLTVGVSRDGTGRHRRINVQQVQNVLLVWLDSSAEDNSDDCRNTITQLRRAINDTKTYTDGDHCIRFIETVKDNRICMIISGALGQHVVPHVHDMSQVDSIFIFCGNKSRHEQWAKAWPKIKGVFTEISPICEALKQAAQQCEHNATPMSFVATGRRLDQLDPTFMYTQILKEILSTMDFDEQHITNYADYCREAFADNDVELKNIEQLEQHYHDYTPIWWYTCECFIFPMLNRALRVMDGEVMIRMGFFINDLHRQLEQMHDEQYASHSPARIFTVYRGQGLSKVDFDQLVQSKGGLMSFNNFLSTSTTRSVSLNFAQRATINPDLVRILFVMQIDPAQSTTPFASIHQISAVEVEDEVLFGMHSVFRVHDIKSIESNKRLYEVQLSLTSDNDEELRALTDRIREESSPDTKGWERLALVLQNMGQLKMAEDIYEALLDEATGESEKAAMHSQLGSIKYGNGEYEVAITFYEKALTIQLQSLPPDHPDLAATYNNIGAVYDSIGDYATALSSYEKALAIKERSFSPADPSLAASFNNIGNVYGNMEDYRKALSSFERALAIQQQSLPTNHPDLAASYNNIGEVHRNMDDYPKALASHQKALAIRQQSLPTTHPSLASSYNNIGEVYRNMDDYPKALAAHEKALTIREASLPPTHPDLAMSHKNIGLLYENMGNYPRACSFLESAVQIAEHSLPNNHPRLKEDRNNLERIKKRL